MFLATRKAARKTRIQMPVVAVVRCRKRRGKTTMLEPITQLYSCGRRCRCCSAQPQLQPRITYDLAELALN